MTWTAALQLLGDNLIADGTAVRLLSLTPDTIKKVSSRNHWKWQGGTKWCVGQLQHPYCYLTWDQLTQITVWTQDLQKNQIYHSTINSINCGLGDHPLTLAASINTYLNNKLFPTCSWEICESWFSWFNWESWFSMATCWGPKFNSAVFRLPLAVAYFSNDAGTYWKGRYFFQRIAGFKLMLLIGFRHTFSFSHFWRYLRAHNV